MAKGKQASKRKAEETEESDHEEQAPKPARKTKKARKEASQAESAVDNTQPTNKELPEVIEFPARTPNTFRLASWNVSGLQASQKKGFHRYIEAEDPDVIVITETKMNQKPELEALEKRFPHQYWTFSTKKGYAGTAVLSKEKPLTVEETIPNYPDAEEIKGRIVTLEFKTCYFVGTYVVNAGVNLKFMEAKETWMKSFFPYLTELDMKKPVIWAGDLNVAPTALDLANPKPNWNKTPGYTEAETSGFKNFLNPPGDPKAPKFVDLWRNLHPEERSYTYFSYRFNCRSKGIGWRIDGFVLSERLASRVKMCEIRGEIYGASDHLPVVMEIEGEL
ncbi:unnamed protein product [Cyclocybe aegerita]|uniref:Endonuclease/exonuclease/phosphatase domain-containing protein n=1 Tax=Cyclocybe aegerita TaxID=1973307 RepID=A0A8S0WK02_CYCAE|nr:unnamed protein product [Cyclocybe aegerita]